MSDISRREAKHIFIDYDHNSKDWWFGEKCWFKVISGTLEICNYKLESRTPLKLKEIEKINAHKGYLDGPADIHSVNNFSQEPVVTLHIYAKPYDSCETYNIETKQIKRMEMKYHSIDGKLC